MAVSGISFDSCYFTEHAYEIQPFLFFFLLVASLGCLRIRSSHQQIGVIFPLPFSIISLLLLVALAMTLSTRLDVFASFLILEKKPFSFPHLLVIGLSCLLFMMFRYAVSTSSFFEVLFQEKAMCWTMSRAFLHLLKYHVISVLEFMCCITLLDLSMLTYLPISRMNW